MLAARRLLTTLAIGVTCAVGFMPALASLPAAAAPADSVRNSQDWVLNMLDVPAAWQLSKGAGVTVAVLDSGVYPGISDLSGSVTRDLDLTSLKTPQSSPHWGEHGTWMASIIAGHGHGFDDLDGITGVAPSAKILSIRVIPDKDDPGYHQYEAEQEQAIQNSLARGIRDAVRDGAAVISMSIGYSSPSSAVRSALEYAHSRGVVLVASSGNSGHDDERQHHGLAPVSFPADYPGVLSVGALNNAGAAANFSSNNLSVQVGAPGVHVPAQGRDNLYWTVDGTSPACALVAGVAALIKSKYPQLAPDLVIEALTTTAKHPSGGYNPQTGFGTVDAFRALRAAGRLAKTTPARSQVASAARFGGGPSAIPAAPVAPRGTGRLVMFILLAIVSLALVLAAAAWLAVLRRPRSGAHAAYPPRPAAEYPAAGNHPQDDGYPPPGAAR